MTAPCQFQVDARQSFESIFVHTEQRAAEILGAVFMSPHQILAIMLCALACLNQSNTSAKAGWFGPSNYDECVLEKMKGQPRFMLKTAEAACRAQFPPERQEVQLMKTINWSWCEAGTTQQAICILKSPKNYEITRVEAQFSDATPCTIEHPSDYDQWDSASKIKYAVDLLKRMDWQSASGTKSYFSSKFTFETPPRKYGCVYVEFFGFEE